MTLDECRRVLGITRSAGVEDLREAKKRLLLRLHPDQNPERQEWADAETRKVLHAYDLLAAHALGASTPRVAPPSSTSPGRPWQSVVTVDARPPTPPAAPGSEHEPRLLHYVLAETHGQLLALPLASVEKVLPLKHDEILSAGSWRCQFSVGRVRHDDMPIPLIDLGAAVGVGADGIADCRHFVVVHTESRQRLAVAVERVRRVVHVNAAAIEPATSACVAREPWLKGYFRIDDGCAAVADVDLLFA